MTTTEQDHALLHAGMLQRPVDPTRYRGTARPDKTARWAAVRVAEVEDLRGRSSGEWPTPLALPDALRQLGELLTELGWDDLACLARREELAVYRELAATRPPGAFADEIDRVLRSLRETLVGLGRFEAALAVVDEQLRRSDSGPTGQRAAADVRQWRTMLLARLGRWEEAVESASMVVSEIRERLAREGTARVSLELVGALTVYAAQLDGAGRVAEAADVTADVVAYWRRRSRSTVRFARTADLFSDRLARSGRAEDARAAIVDAMRRIRRRADSDEDELAATWHDFSRRLLALDLPGEALTAGQEAVRCYRERVRLARQRHREVLADEDWDSDHRYAWWHLHQQRSGAVDAATEMSIQAGRDLRDALLTTGACLRQLGRIDEAVEAEAEAAELVGPSGEVAG